MKAAIGSIAKKLLVAAFLIFAGPQTIFAESGKTDSIVGKDKFEHFTVSAAIVSSTAFVFHNHFQTKRDDAIVIGFSAGLSLGGIKELIDKRTPGEQSSWKDLVADIIGCAVGAIVIRGVLK